ncbi:class I SAM-dependent rRNA methyltransferase [Streptococcus merionis]|uniref:class I SAM-dependent rRNA methyltransferase n=1 Tax=Streptococcus merionis TaxID=400065 RepID=UPI0035151B1F
MEKISLNQSTERKVLKGINLIEKGDLPDNNLDNIWVEFQGSRGQFLAKGYLSAQNKGAGWVITRQQEELDLAFFVTLFQMAWNKRQAYHESKLITAYRIFNQDGDGFGGLTIDFYDGYSVFSWYNEFIYSQRTIIIEAFQKALPQIKGGYEKIRFKGLDYESQHLFGQEAPETFTVLENGVCYQVFLNDGLMTGIFLDQHEVRGSLVDGLAAGQSVLNLFSYTAAFSVAAAMGGAAETTSVDLAKRSRELSQAHFEANHLELDHHRFVVMDVFDYFKYAKRHNLSYDIIILDPPSFARNKKKTFSVAKDYHNLIVQSLEILNPNGILIASTNAANLTISKFKEQIEKGFGSQAHNYVQTYRLPADFQINKKDESSNYLKVFTIGI